MAVMRALQAVRGAAKSENPCAVARFVVVFLLDAIVLRCCHLEDTAVVLRGTDQGDSVWVFLGIVIGERMRLLLPTEAVQWYRTDLLR